MPVGRVTIRIWSPKESLISFSTKSVGHVSLQTYRGGLDEKGYYVSMYPDGKASLFDPRHSQKLVGPNKDMLDHPAISYDKKEIDLYSLDVEAINAAFEDFKKSNYDWSLFASSLLAASKTQNCSGLVYALLKAGGIEKHLNLLARMLLGIKKYAPSPIRVLGIVFPFAAYLTYKGAKAAGVFSAVFGDTVPFPDSYSRLKGLIAAQRADNFDSMEYSPFEIHDFYNNSPSHTDLVVMNRSSWFFGFVNNISKNIGWLLGVVDRLDSFVGNAGVGISAFIVISAGIYLAAAGTGSVASFSVITPSDITTFASQVKKLQIKQQSFCSVP